MTRLRSALLLALLAPVLAACGDDLGLGTRTEIAIDAVADTRAGPGPVQGQITVDATAALITAAGVAEAVTLTPATRVLRIEGAAAQGLASRRVPADEYTRVRVVFHRIEVFIEAGFGGGVLPGLSRVAIPPEGLVVEAPIQISAATPQQHLLIDLRALAWIGQTDPIQRLIPAVAVQNAVRIVSQ